jgi:thiosulfate dehydrogenase [quinone] large subunit
MFWSGNGGADGRRGAEGCGMADVETVADHGRRGRRRPPAADGEGEQGRGARFALLPLRLFLGATFVYAGLDKLSDPHYLAGAGDPVSFVAQTQAVRAASPIGPLLDQALRTPTPFALAMAFGELAVGLGALLGFWTRLAAAGGVLISASLWLTVSWQVHPYYLGNDLPFLVAWLPLVLAGAPNLSVDALLAARSARERADGTGPGTVRRRALVDGSVAAIAVAGTGLLAGSLAARLGRRDGGTAAQPGTATPPSGAGAVAGVGNGTAASPPSAGAASVAAADVRVGGAVRTTDPATGDAVYVLQPEQGRYTALSAVCPHARCVVNPPKDGKLVCPCHNSVFDAVTGARESGPSPTGLARYGITRSGDRLELGPQQT